MDRKMLVRAFVSGVFALGLAAWATPAAAQDGTLKGRVVDAEGKPVPDAEIRFEYVGEFNLRMTVRTNAQGEFIRAGLRATGGGRWNLAVTKGELSATTTANVPIGEVRTIPDIVVRPGGATAAAGGAEAAAAVNKQNAMLKAAYTQVQTQMAANDVDGAIATLTDLNTKVEKCGGCYLRLGDAYAKKNDAAAAEKAYLQAVEFDATNAEVYDALATFYNQQRKFDEAGKASAKAMEIRGAAGGTADPTSLYNAGIIFWNQGKIAEAKGQFEKALALNPKLAEAHYYYGMTLVNEGKVAEAKKSLETYLQLAPTGANAPVAKSVLDTMK